MASCFIKANKFKTPWNKTTLNWNIAIYFQFATCLWTDNLYSGPKSVASWKHSFAFMELLFRFTTFSLYWGYCHGTWDIEIFMWSSNGEFRCVCRLLFDSKNIWLRTLQCFANPWYSFL
jgi:hypothetical protein